ncbi:MAG TPA: hypothetical protein DE179_13795, partial [Oceanospirillaceae bacterium]|nr:hypothetical protein [Oceanospirillaceae bacterium]
TPEATPEVVVAAVAPEVVAVAPEQLGPVCEVPPAETPPEPQVETASEVPTDTTLANASAGQTSHQQVVGHVNVDAENLPIMADVPPWEETPAGWQGQTSAPVAEQPVVRQTASVSQPVAEAMAEPSKPQEPAPAPVISQPKAQWTLADLDQSNWANIFRDLDIDGLTRSIAANMVFARRVGTQLTFTLEQGQTSMLNAAHQGRIRQSLEAMFACDLQLAIDIGNTETETPFARRERRLGQHQQAAVESLQADPYVDKLAQVFNGQLDLSTVEPVQSFEE